MKLSTATCSWCMSDSLRHWEIQKVTTHKNFNREGTFYQAFDKNFSARTEFDLSDCRNYGNVLTLFILSIALHLIAERLASSTANIIFD